MKKISTLIILLIALKINAQVNGYAKVTSISGVNLTVSNPNETYGTFTNGSKVIVMQMQDDVIGSNTSQNTSFGNLSSIASAGRYEVAIINTVTRVSGTLTAIKLTTGLGSTYNTGSNSSVQVITFPTLGSGGFTTTANITAVAWDGNRGGVIAFNVNGTLTLNHNITADNAGFRGGVADASSSPYGSCNSVDFYHAVDPLYGNKGEGIYKATNANFSSGKGKILNGGGGGNTINAGGGGGGNYTAGGDGYFGWSCSLGTGGIGGLALNTYFASGDRLFMGGGGGSGEANDNYDDKGGNGGGIIIIQATTIRTTGSGTARVISANGQLGNGVGNDGAGGAGAGGSIALLVTSYNIAATKPLTIAANGGNGGDVGNAAQHGGGGGGGEGAVLFSGAQPTTNITTSTTAGTGGASSTGGTHASSGGGTAGAGIIPMSINILPLHLVSFTAVKDNDRVALNWKTENEVNTSRFEIQRSANGTLFETIGIVVASGNSVAQQTYSFTDPKSISAVTYYRLRMVDMDGKYTYSNVLVMRASNSLAVDVTIFPNPAASNASLYIKSDVSTMAAIRLVNMQGATVYTQQNLVSKGENIVPVNRISGLSNGVYNVQVTLNNNTFFTRLIVQK